MYNIKDDIVALATSPEKAALHVVRCSGFGVVNIIKKMVSKSFKPKANYCSLCSLFDPTTLEVLDQAVVTVFLGPKSYTGQNVVELSVHGGFVVSKKIIRVLVELGMRPALPGEFSYRAFVNGKIDLIQAEAVASLIESNSNIDAFFSLKNLRGGVSTSVNKIKKSLVDIITYIEHELDFNEGEVEFRSCVEYKNQAQVVLDSVVFLLDSLFVGQQRNYDVSICIAGKTNVGKSSLFNKLCGYERSIVTKVAGTTRDVVELPYFLDDMSVSLVDTAGLREKAGVIEKKGINKAIDAINFSDFVLFVDDEDPKQAIKTFPLKLKNKEIIFVHNKIDKNTQKHKKGVFNISCLKDLGIKKLSTHLHTKIKSKSDRFLSNYSFVVSARVRVGLEAFKDALCGTINDFEKNKELVVFVSALRSSLELIEDVSSPIKKDEIINNIFGSFCVGK